MPINVCAKDGSIQSFPDGTSPAAIRFAMLAHENQDAWGGMAAKVRQAVGQVTKAASEGMRLQGESAMSQARGTAQVGRTVWEFPGKFARAVDIGKEEVRKWEDAAQAATHRKEHAIDNKFDAQRHAEWSARMAKELGPAHAKFLTDLWELNPLAHDTPEAHAMDRYNNWVAIQSVREGRPYTLDNLQLAPGIPPKTPRGSSEGPKKTR